MRFCKICNSNFNKKIISSKNYKYIKCKNCRSILKVNDSRNYDNYIL